MGRKKRRIRDRKTAFTATSGGARGSSERHRNPPIFFWLVRVNVETDGWVGRLERRKKKTIIMG
jgi:hypothetical protein